MLIPKNVFSIGKFTDQDCTRYALGGVRLERGEAGEAIAIATDGRRLVAVEWDDSNNKNAAGQLGSGEAVENYETIIPVDDWREAEKTLTLPDNKRAKVVGNAIAPKAVENENESQRKQREAVEKTIAKRSIYGQCYCDESTTNGSVKLSSTDGQKTRSLECKTADGRFPNWRDVIPNDDKLKTEYVSLTIDWQLLAQACEVVAKAANAGADQRGVELLVPIGEAASDGEQRESDGQPVLIRHNVDAKVTGVVMPMATDQRPKR